MKLLFFVLLILSSYPSICQESNNEIVGTWTVIDVGITGYACEINYTGIKYEFLSSGRLKIYREEKKVITQRFENLFWNFSSENSITIQSEDGKIVFRKFKFHLNDEKLYLNTRLFSIVLEKNNLPQQRL